MLAIPVRMGIGAADVDGTPRREIEDGAASTVAPQDEAQAAAGDSADEWGARHAVNIRLTIPLLFTCYYVTFVAGKERRSSARRKAERRKHPLSTFGNTVFLFGLGTMVGLALLALVQFLGAFLLKEAGFWVIPS